MEGGSRVSLMYGYLLGAAEAASESTEGIHTELLRRLTVAARFAADKQPLDGEFQQAYREGFDAGSAAEG